MIAPTSDEDNNDNSNAPSLIQIASISDNAVHFSVLVILLLLKSEKKELFSITFPHKKSLIDQLKRLQQNKAFLPTKEFWRPTSMPYHAIERTSDELLKRHDIVKRADRLQISS